MVKTFDFTQDYFHLLVHKGLTRGLPQKWLHQHTHSQHKALGSQHQEQTTQQSGKLARC